MTEDTYRGKPDDPLSLNLYTYCHNEPMMYVDPTGHEEFRNFLIPTSTGYIVDRLPFSAGSAANLTPYTGQPLPGQKVENHSGSVPQASVGDNSTLINYGSINTVSTENFANTRIINYGNMGVVFTGYKSTNDISNNGSIIAVFTGANSTNIFSGSGNMDLLWTGFGNSSTMNGITPQLYGGNGTIYGKNKNVMSQGNDKEFEPTGRYVADKLLAELIWLQQNVSSANQVSSHVRANQIRDLMKTSYEYQENYGGVFKGIVDRSSFFNYETGNSVAENQYLLNTLNNLINKWESSERAWDVGTTAGGVVIVAGGLQTAGVGTALYEGGAGLISAGTAALTALGDKVKNFLGGTGTTITNHGAQRLAERGFTTAEVALTKATNTIKTQADGAIVFIKEITPGKFNVIVEGKNGIITALKNISQKSLDRLSNNYGWKD